MKRDVRKRGRVALAFGLLGGLGIAFAAQAQPPQRNLNNGDDKTLALTNPGKPAGPAPKDAAPPNPDMHDLQGHWWTSEFKPLLSQEPGVPPPLKPKYMAVLEARIRNKNKGIPEADASTQCWPHGTPRVMESPYPIEIVETPGQITILMETQHNIRRIYMTDHHTPGLGESFLGDSIGHWEGDTLVVDTVGVNTRTFIDDEGTSHSDKEHVVERIRKIDGGARLEIVNTIDDPETLFHPYSYRTIYHWRPDVRDQEYICEENNRNTVINGITTAK
jgi:hypothetical protein